MNPNGSLTARLEKKRKSGVDWFLWWQIDPTELRRQVSKYRQLKIWQSAKGLSFVFLMLSAALSAGLIEFVSHNRTGYIDVAVSMVLAGFIYFGHRWAMIAAMLFWTVEKGYQLAQGTPAMVSAVIWWTVYMHAFYLSLRTEFARRKPNLADAFD